MTEYRRGSLGEEVEWIQDHLKQQGVYRGPVDGVFGGGTESAVREFQNATGLKVDGVVGPKTWDMLFLEEIPEPEIVKKPLAYRCLALTGAFETGQPMPECFAGLSGDFDGQGISFGALQWNFGQGTLQRLLQSAFAGHTSEMQGIFGTRCDKLQTVVFDYTWERQMQWARSLQDLKLRIKEPWAGCFKALGRTGFFQEIQVKAAKNILDDARVGCVTYELQSERALALLFDVLVQNGKPSFAEHKSILGDFCELDCLPELSEDPRAMEQARLRVIAKRIAEGSKPRWAPDVMKRKMAIAEGVGAVHGRHYDLAGQYGIRLNVKAA